MAMTGSQWVISICGSISKPIATKKTALNMSRTGSIKSFDPMDFARLGDDRADDERAERHAVTQFHRQQRNAKTKPSTVTRSISLLLNLAT